MEKIANERYANQVKIYHRLKENATDMSPTIDVVLEFLKLHKFKGDDNFILLQSTSPLTTSSDILNLHKKILESKSDSFLACVRMKKFRWSEEGISLDYSMDNKPRRQDYKGFLVESGAFYCSKVGKILELGKLISGNIGIIELGSQAIIDIDDPIDWKMGEAYIRYLKNNPNG